MAIVNAWLCYETSTTTGTGAYTLSGTPFDANRATFASVINDQDQVVYVAHGDGDNYEVNIGTWTAAGNTMSRDTILFSTNGGLPINWGAGTKSVYGIQEPLVTTGFLQSANNLSDVSDVPTTRSNLGLGTAALENIGKFLQTDANFNNINVASGNADMGLFANDGASNSRFDVGESPSGKFIRWSWQGAQQQASISVNDGVDLENIATIKQGDFAFAPGLSISGLDGAVGYMRAILSANQTSNLAAGNHIEFDSIQDDSGDISLSTGTGQQRGLFTVPPGVWLVLLHLVAVGISDTSGFLQVQPFDQTSAEGIGNGTLHIAPNAGDSAMSSPSAAGLVNTTSGNVVIKAEIIQSSNIDHISTTATQLFFIGLRRN